MHTDFVWSDNWFLNALLFLSYWSTVYYPLSRLFVLILHLQHGVLIFSFKHQIRWWKVQWFPSTWFLTGVDVIGKLGLSSVIYSGLDTMSASRISFSFCWWSHLPACWYIFFMLFKHLCSKEDLFRNNWSIPIFFIWSSRRVYCNISLITIHCCSNVSIERI